MRTIETVRTVAGDGWRGWDRLSDRECRRIGVARGSIVNPRDPHYVIYSPARNGGYDNTSTRARSLDRHSSAEQRAMAADGYLPAVE